MKEYAEILKFIAESKSLDYEKLLSILIVAADRLDIDTVSGMAEKENKTPAGIRLSNNYRKIKIGRSTLVVNGLCETNLPF